jgi:hypothetical protein
MARTPPLIELCTPITKELFAQIDEAVRRAGYAEAIERSEAATLPLTADEFAAEVIYVAINAGFANRIAVPIFERCMAALRKGKSSKTVYGHPGKTDAIDEIWKRRASLFRKLKKADDLIEFCATLPWTGPITKFHLAKNLGADVAKPDVHLNRLADSENLTAQKLCDRLATESGYRSATVDLILWRACADGIIHSR